MMIPAPGTYYGRERYFNQIRIEPKVNYGFTVRKVNLCESFMHHVSRSFMLPNLDTMFMKN